MAENKETEELSPLIDIGTCGLYAVHNILSKSMNEIVWVDCSESHESYVEIT